MTSAPAPTADLAPGRRERKKLATRAALSSAALRLAAEQGVDHVTTEQIADEADVAVRTFFNHFSSKEEAVVAGDFGTAEFLVRAFRARPDDESLFDALRSAVLGVIGDPVYDDRHKVEQMRTLRRTPSLLPHQLAVYAAHERSLAAAIAARIGADTEHDVRPTLIAATAMTALRVILQHGLADPTHVHHGPSLAELTEQAFAQLGHGLDVRRAADRKVSLIAREYAVTR